MKKHKTDKRIDATVRMIERQQAARKRKLDKRSARAKAAQKAKE